MNEDERWNMVTDTVATLCDAGHDVTHAEVIQALDMVGWDVAPAVSQWKDKRIAALESELATMKEWLFNVVWSNCDCAEFSLSAERDPSKHEEGCEYRIITTRVHVPEGVIKEQVNE